MRTYCFWPLNMQICDVLVDVAVVVAGLAELLLLLIKPGLHCDISISKSGVNRE